MMPTDKESANEFKITAVCTITDPVERQQRLAQAFAHLLAVHEKHTKPTRLRLRAAATD